MVDNNSADDENILTLDVHDAISDAVLTTLTVTRKQFVAPFRAQNFTTFIKFPDSSPTQLEFRVYYQCCSFVVHEVRGCSP